MRLLQVDSGGSLADLQSVLGEGAPTLLPDSTALQLPDLPETPSPRISSSLQWLGCFHWGTPTSQQAAVPAVAAGSSGSEWAPILSSSAWLAARIPAVESSFTRDATLQLCAGSPAELGRDNSSSGGIGGRGCTGYLWPQAHTPVKNTFVLGPRVAASGRPPTLILDSVLGQQGTAAAATAVYAGDTHRGSSGSGDNKRVDQDPHKEAIYTIGATGSSSSSWVDSACHPPPPVRLGHWPQQPWLLDWLQQSPSPTRQVAPPHGLQDSINSSHSSSSREGWQRPRLPPGHTRSSSRAAGGAKPGLVVLHPQYLAAPVGTGSGSCRPPLLPMPASEAAACASPAAAAEAVLTMKAPHLVAAWEAPGRGGCCTALFAGPMQLAWAVGWAMLQLPLVTAAASSAVWQWAGLELPSSGEQPLQEDSCRSSGALSAVGAALAGERLVRRARCWDLAPGGWPQQVAVVGGGSGGQPG